MSRARRDGGSTARRERPGLLDALLARPRTVLALWALAIAAALPGLLALRIDNSPTAYFLEGTRERADFARFEAAFGSARVVRLVVSGEKRFDPSALDWLDRAARRAAELPDVVAVVAPPAAEGARRAPLARRDGEEREAFGRRLAAGTLDRALGLVGRDAGALSLLVTLAPGDADRRRAELAALDELVRGAPPGLAVELVGLPVLDRVLDEAARGVLVRLLPLLIAVSLFLLWLLFRDLSAVAILGVFVAAIGALVFGAMGALGVALDLVVAILPPLLFSIALAVGVHLLLRYRNAADSGEHSSPVHERARRLGAVRLTFAEKGRALFWTTVSTVAGFGSLAATPVAPVRTLGIWGAVAMLTTGVAAYTLLPPLLRLHALHPPAADGDRESTHGRRLEAALKAFGRRTAIFAARHRRAVLLVYGALAALAAAGVLRLEVESNALDYFPPAAPIRRTFDAAERHGIGLATVELLGTTGPGDTSRFASAAGLEALARLEGDLGRIPGAISTVSAASLLGAVGQATPLARAFSGGELASRVLPLLRADAYGGRAVAGFLTADNRTARITLFVPTAGFEVIDPLVAAALSRARSAVPFADWRATGELPLLLATQHQLLDTLAVSLAWALPLLAAVFFFILRSVRGAILALLPNVWPVLVILGAMGWLGVPVDIATVMVASIIAGLVVDDTIHTLTPYRELARRVGGQEAVAERLEKTAPAFVVAGLVLASGFAICTLSSFLPVARFGALSVIAIAIALAADLFLVPALFGSPLED